MPFRRRYSARRPRRYGPRATRRILRRTRRRMPMIRSPRYHTFERMTGVGAATLTSNTSGLSSTGFIGGVATFRLSDLINASELTALYDQFRILRATVYFQWQTSPTDTTQLQANVLLNPPILEYFPDYDDNSVPNASEFHERSTTRYKALRPGRATAVSVRPAVLAQMFESSVAAAYSPKWRQWLDMGDNAALHYGLKFGFKYPTSTPYGQVSTWTKLVVQCKGQR